jgi:hypothetical protein
MTKFNLAVEKGDELWFITSDDAVPGGRLFIAEHTLTEALAAVPKTMRDMRDALGEHRAQTKG